MFLHPLSDVPNEKLAAGHWLRHGTILTVFWNNGFLCHHFSQLEWCRGQMIGPTVKMKVKGERACDKHKRIVLFFVEKQNVWKLETSSLLRFPSLPHRIMLPTVVFFATSAYIFMWHKNSSIFGIGDTATPTEQYHSIAISSNVCCSLEYQAVHMTELLIHPSGWINDERMAVHCLESGCIGLYIWLRDFPQPSRFPLETLSGLRKSFSWRECTSQVELRFSTHPSAQCT